MAARRFTLRRLLKRSQRDSPSIELGARSDLLARAEAGEITFTWRAMGDGLMCPNCAVRHGVGGLTLADWQAHGLPGDEEVACSHDECRCVLLPDNLLSVGQAEVVKRPAAERMFTRLCDLVGLSLSARDFFDGSDSMKLRLDWDASSPNAALADVISFAECERQLWELRGELSAALRSYRRPGSEQWAKYSALASAVDRLLSGYQQARRQALRESGLGEAEAVSALFARSSSGCY